MIVAIVGILCFGLLALLNWYVGRSLIYPGVVLAGIWTLQFIVQSLSGGILYPISWAALFIFVIGCMAFTVGAVVGNGGVRMPQPVKKPERVHAGDRLVLHMLLVALLLGLIVYMVQLRTLTSASLFSFRYFYEIRQLGIELSGATNRAPLVNNLVPLSTIAAMIGYAVTDAGRRWRVIVWSLIGLSLVYNLLTGAKVGLVVLAVALVAIHITQRRRVSVHVAVAGFLAVFLLFGAVTYGGGGPVVHQMSLAELVGAGWGRFVAYFAVSPVGFSLYLDDPSLVPAVWSPWYFFMRTANYFGSFFTVPVIHAQFLDVGPGAVYNTYTVYFSYYPAYGVAGVVAFMGVIGAICSWIYCRALEGKLVWLLLYAMLFYGLLMTIFNESLLWGLNFDLKLVIVTLAFLATRQLKFLQRYANSKQSRWIFRRGNKQAESA